MLPYLWAATNARDAWRRMPITFSALSGVYGIALAILFLFLVTASRFPPASHVQFPPPFSQIMDLSRKTPPPLPPYVYPILSLLGQHASPPPPTPLLFRVLPGASAFPPSPRFPSSSCRYSLCLLLSPSFPPSSPPFSTGPDAGRDLRSLKRVRGEQVSPSMIWRFFDRHDITLKKSLRTQASRSPGRPGTATGMVCRPTRP